MNILEALNWAKKYLKKTSSPSLDAEVLLSFVLSMERGWLFANPDFNLTSEQFNKFKKIISKRRHHWPVAYLVGHKKFFGLDFKVTPDVLIPRPETELLVEKALQILEPSPPLRERERLHSPSPPRPLQGERVGVRGWHVIDLGTGSGNIIISLIQSVIAIRRRRRSNLEFYATDISKKALTIAHTNARRHGVAKRIKFLHGNLLEAFSPLLRGRLRGGRILILANLPYLTPRQYSSNPDLKHEPRLALVAGRDGLKYFRELFEQISKLPSSPGDGEELEERSKIILLLEHSPSQKEKLKLLASHYFPSATIRPGRTKGNLGSQAQILFHKDLAKHYRIMELLMCYN